MIILLFFVFLGLTVLTILADVEDLAFLPLLGAFVCLIVGIVLCVSVTGRSVIDKKCNVPKRKYKNRKSNGRACIAVYEI